jgi:exportin-7
MLNGAVNHNQNKKLSPLSAPVQALSRAMSGNYVNFGVFELYGDNALKDALAVAMQMVLSIPLQDMMSYK